MEFLAEVGGQPGDVVLDALLAEHGPLEEHRDVPETLIAPLIGTVPDLLIDLWRAHGVGALRERGLWLVMPGTLDAVADRMFAGDPDFGGDTTIIVYGAMGNLLCWNVRHGPMLVESVGGAVQAPGLMRPAERRPDDTELLRYLRELHPFFFDRVDSANERMLDRARKKLGPLSAGQVYATYPVQTLGEDIGIANVVIDDINAYLTEIVLGIGFMLQDYEGKRFNIRDIGGVR